MSRLKLILISGHTYNIYNSICVAELVLNHPDEAILPPNVRVVNSPLRLRGLPDKMATSNGGGMEVDGAGECFSLISSFVPDINTDLNADCRLCCIFVLLAPLRDTLAVLKVLVASCADISGLSLHGCYKAVNRFITLGV